jgi:hypothetical protein
LKAFFDIYFCNLCALRVFFISIETVNAHTQPGTGVILFQVKSISLVSASHIIFQSTTVNHTSITVVPCFIISTFNIHGFQAATTTMSAILVYFLISLVILLQLITVAQAFISNAVIGFQTILLLHTTHTTFHSKFIFSFSNISIIQAGVHGTNHLLSFIRTFH